MERMRRQNGETYVEPIAMSRLMTEVSDFFVTLYNLILTNTLALTNHPEVDIAQPGLITRLITSW